MLNEAQKNQFSEILEELGKSLDITEEQHKKAVSSYEYVGEWLAAESSPISKYRPEILPQGSFMLGTLIRPINEDDDLDIDLVCRLEGKDSSWTQFHLKQIVGQRLVSNGTIRKLVEIPDGRRCWTLKYSESSKFHMDVLPSIVSTGYKIILSKAFTESQFKDMNSLAIRITDKREYNYKTATDPAQWLKSNPFGYGAWFAEQASISFQKSAMFSEAVQPIPKYKLQKLPLQRAIQILKRHRDIMFNGDDDKPISIIITTLAAMSYNGESNVTDTLSNVIEQMPYRIGERYSPKHRREIKWIPNPVNPEENFADKWAENPQKETNFYEWLKHVKMDITRSTEMRGIHMIQESFEKPFGKDAVLKAFNNYGENQRIKRESGSLKMAAGTGMLGDIGTKVKGHNFHGEE